MSTLPNELANAELEVLNVLWDEGPIAVRDVMNHLHQQGRKLAYTTVLTFLTRLEQKGFVASDKSGLAYVYKPTVTRARVQRSKLKTLVRELYDGAAAPLVMQLIRNERFSDHEIREFQSLIESLDGKGKKSQK